MVKKGRIFEEKTVEFLKKMQFEAVDGARDTLKIGSFIPDAIGVKNGVIFVIECKDGEKEHSRQCLQRKMLEFRGRFVEYRSALKKHTIYGKFYKKKNGKNIQTVWFVLATKNIIVNQTDIDHCRFDKPRMQDIWTAETMEYYTELYEKMDAKCPAEKETGKKCPQCQAKEYWSIYDFLGEIRLFKDTIQGVTSPKLRVPANSTYMGDGVTMYQFTMNPRDLAEVAYVARRDVRDKAFYQRQITKGRIESIGRYINSKSNLLVNNIILAFDKSAERFVSFPDNSIQGTLTFPKDYKCCWIIDGQHRFYGFRHATRDLKVPIAVLKGLDVVKQSKIFLDINEFQAAVPPALVWDLKGDLMFPEPEAIISRAVKKINMDGIDGIKNTIGIPSQAKSTTGMKKFAAMCTAILDLKLATPTTLSDRANPSWNGKDHNKTVDNLFKHLNAFFKAMKQVFPEDFARGHQGFVLGEGSGAVMLYLFERIIQYSVDNSNTTFKDPDPDSLTFDQQIPVNLDHSLFLHCLTPIKDEITEWATDTTTGDENKLAVAKGTCGNKAGQNRYFHDFVRTIRKGIKDETFAKGLVDLPPHRDYQLAEEEARNLLEEIYMPKHGAGWLAKLLGAGSDQYKKIQSTAGRKKCTDPELFHKYATVGQSAEIIIGHIDDFSDIFLAGSVRFDSRDELKVALAKIREYKADGSHIQPGKGNKANATLADTYLSKFKDCIASYRSSKKSQPSKASTPRSVVPSSVAAEKISELKTRIENEKQTPENTDKTFPAY